MNKNEMPEAYARSTVNNSRSNISIHAENIEAVKKLAEVIFGKNQFIISVPE